MDPQKKCENVWKLEEGGTETMIAHVQNGPRDPNKVKVGKIECLEQKFFILGGGLFGSKRSSNSRAGPAAASISGNFEHVTVTISNTVHYSECIHVSQLPVLLLFPF